ncbi:MAG: NAD(P)H-dependent oxidoreductase [Tissierellia bacterium]|nr:NAD(P)H-dependent oxidoreductase [Tissierellia bacterium]
MKKVGIILGSLRRESYARKWANNIVEFYPKDYEVKIIEISQLPFYNEEFDEEGPLPEVIQAFRDEMETLDGVVFVTPEYNRSIPPALKNALDIASRPAGSTSMAKKPALIISHSISRLGGFGANHHLRQVLVFLDMPTVAQPEVYLSHSGEAFDVKGKIISTSIISLLLRAVDTHVDLIKRFQ